MARFELPITQCKPIRYGWTLSRYDTDPAMPELLPLSGAQIDIEVRPAPKEDDPNPTALIKFSTTDGTIATPADDGKVDIEFDDVSTTTGTGQIALNDECIFDIKITWPDGLVETEPTPGTPRGKVVFAKDVTR